MMFLYYGNKPLSIIQKELDHLHHIVDKLLYRDA